MIDPRLKHINKDIEYYRQRLEALYQQKDKLVEEIVTEAEISNADVWMNKSQVAEYLSVHPYTVRRKELNGELQFTNGKIKRSEVDRYLMDSNPRKAQKLFQQKRKPRQGEAVRA